jgi:hypothetical protein
MVEVLGLMPAILASVTVALEHRSAIHRDPPLVRDTHVALETDDRR